MSGNNAFESNLIDSGRLTKTIDLGSGNKDIVEVLPDNTNVVTEVRVDGATTTIRPAKVTTSYTFLYANG